MLYIQQSSNGTYSSSLPEDTSKPVHISIQCKIRLAEDKAETVPKELIIKKKTTYII